MRPEEVSLNFKEKVVVTGRFLKRLFLQQETMMFMLFLVPSLLMMVFIDFTIGGKILTGFIHFATSLLIGVLISILICIVIAFCIFCYESARDDLKPFFKRLYDKEENSFKKEILEDIEREHLLK